MTPAVVECARCELPKASFTYASASEASSRDSSGSFLVSPGSKRVFSSTSTSPASSRPTPRRTSGPTTSGAWCTRVPISSPSRLDTGVSENSGSRPLGRPRCEHSTSAAPRPRSSLIVGSAARMRASSATCAVLRAAR